VNGAAGAVVGPPEHPYAVVVFTVRNGRISEIDIVVDRAKLSRAGGPLGT
jgi:hypothetical protein